jgi:hypothetical protein
VPRCGVALDAQAPLGPPPQAFAAAWNAGDCGLTPGRYTRWLPPELLMTFGSGKFGTLWLRMHFAKFSPRRRCCVVCAALAEADGRYLWHPARAARNAGALSETPLTEMVWAFPWISIPLLLKSGKSGTPLARMHFEKASVEPGELEPLPVDALEPGLLGLPEDPQAATALAQATATKGSPQRWATRTI